MALEEKRFVDSITYRAESGHIEVRESIVILRDGVELPGARQYHRHVVDPDVTSYSGEDDKVTAIAKALSAHRKQMAKFLKEQRDKEALF